MPLRGRDADADDGFLRNILRRWVMRCYTTTVMFGSMTLALSSLRQRGVLSMADARV